MKNHTGYFEGRERRKLFYQYWMPDSGESKAFIVGIHGWGTHSDRFKVPAEDLTEKGYALYSFDLRGHWRNAGNTPGHIDSMDHIQKDIVLFMDIVRKDSKDKKIFLMGHSLGGLISLIYAINRPDLPGVIVTSPMLGLSIGKKLAKALTKPLSKLTPTKIMNYEIDQTILTSDLKILRSYLADTKKLNIISVKTAVERQQSMIWAMDNARYLSCPALIMQAGNDKVIDKEKTKEFFEKVKSKDKTYKEYDGFLHDILHEKKRAQVYRDIDIFISKILGIKIKNYV